MIIKGSIKSKTNPGAGRQAARARAGRRSRRENIFLRQNSSSGDTLVAAPGLYSRRGRCQHLCERHLHLKFLARFSVKDEAVMTMAIRHVFFIACKCCFQHVQTHSDTLKHYFWRPKAAGEKQNDTKYKYICISTTINTNCLCLYTFQHRGIFIC